MRPHNPNILSNFSGGPILYPAYLHNFSHLFQDPQDLLPIKTISHKINLIPDASLVIVRPYCYSHFQKNKIEHLIQELLSTGIIHHSTKSFSSPVLLVKKKDGPWRFCIDYRALNNITIKDKFPIPTIDELLDELHDSKYLSKLDLCSRFHHIRMHVYDIHKTAFRTHKGHYEFAVMPFGLSIAPSTFQASMNQLYRPYLRKFVIVFSKYFDLQPHHWITFTSTYFSFFYTFRS